MARRHVPEPEQLTFFGNNGQPPRLQADAGHKEPDGLTPKFNKAASNTQAPKRPVSREQIVALEKKMSRPAHTQEMTPLGNVVGSYDPNRDRSIRHQIKTIQKVLSEKKDVARKAFQKAQFKRKTERTFNLTTRFKR